MDDTYARWKSWDAEAFGLWSPADARYFGWHLERALPGRQALQVLEVGYGNGRFLGWLQSRGHRVSGVEANPLLVQRARDAGITAQERLDQLEAEARFDLVAGFDVLEHVPLSELPGFLQQLAALLRPGGRLLFRFPNAESPFGLRSQHGDITHVSALGASAMRQVCTAVGLQLEHSGDLLPWRAQPAGRRLGALFAQLSRRAFEWRLRKSYGLERGIDLAANETVVLRVAD